MAEDFTFANSLSKEARVGYQKIAKETQDILRKGYYRVNGRKVDLSLTTGIYEFEMVEVYSPNQLNDILNDTDAFMKKKFYAPQDHEITVCQMEGYDAAKEYYHPIIMNYSNPFYPGGGYMAGLDDSEERLCRASSLYQSLSSQKASQMYLYHEYYNSKLNSNYILISSQVAVFRNSYMELVDHPYPVSVLSVACVDRRRIRNHDISESEIDAVMKERIRMSLMVTARNMYRNIIVGVGGCMTFGHSSYRVARYFYEILIEEEYIEMFEHVIFSLSYETEKEVLDNFNTVFGPIAKMKYQSQRKYCKSDQIHTKSREETQQSEVVSIQSPNVNCNYIQTRYPFPECNYKHITLENIKYKGFSQGILLDGVPFVAELYLKRQQRDTVAVFVLPYLEQMNVNNQRRGAQKRLQYSVLCEGLQIVDETIGERTLSSYLQYLEHMNLVNIPKNDLEAYAQVFYDKAGHKIVAIEIILSNLEKTEILIPLQFQSLPQILLEEK